MTPKELAESVLRQMPYKIIDHTPEALIKLLAEAVLQLAEILEEKEL